jgi:hypothetical protein
MRLFLLAVAAAAAFSSHSEHSMRSISILDGIRLMPGASRRLVRVSVQDQTGSWRDLTTYPGFNAVVSVSWKEDVDSPGMSADIKLSRAQDSLNLSPLASSSALNKSWNPAGSLNTLLGLKRGVKIEWGFAPDEDRLAPDSWHLAFEGQIDSIDWPDDEIALSCRGLEAALMDTFIERERVYAYAQGVNATRGAYIFETGRAYATNDLVVPSQAAANGHFYKCTTPGTSNSTTEPSWPTGGGSTVTSGTATFTEQGSASDSAGTAVETILQQLITDHVSSPPTLYVPTSPSWSIRFFQQQRQSVWEAVRALVTQIGWDIRYQWDNGTSAFRLTLIQPDRTKSVDDHTFTAGAVMGVSQCEQKIDDIRNAVRVVYSDSTDRDANGEPKRKTLDVTDSTSISNYGRRFMEIAEGSTSNIDSSSEATTLANAALDDLSTPVLDFSPEVELFPFAQLGDLYGFSADRVHFDTDQHLAVVGIEHSVDQGTAQTHFTVRGKPSGGIDRWLEQDTRASRGGHRLALFDSISQGLAVSEIVGGTKLQLTEHVGKTPTLAEYEFHVSTSNGFTPDSSTLVHRGSEKTAVIPDLLPGATYYAKVIPVGRNAPKPVRGQASPQQSFVAGYVQGRHVFPYLDFRRYPLNGSFESPGTVGLAPDVWAIDTGANGTDFEVNNHNPVSGASGTMSLEFKATAVSAALKSGWVPVRDDAEYEFRYFLQVLAVAASGHNAYVGVIWYDNDQTVISSTTDTLDLHTVTTGYHRTRVTPPATAAWAKIFVSKDAQSDVRFTADDVELAGPFDPWHAPTLVNNWANVGGINQVAGYTKTEEGLVRLRGNIKRTSGSPGASETILTLPVGYRPSAAMIFPSPGNNSGAPGRLDVTSDGVLHYIYGDYAGVMSLDVITFDQR